ncbi:MAG: rhodanese-like domain-containing protein [bacterium]|nr:rhodanese-like domain-containing protein [Planctomycetota bacterium]HIL50802.1 rhodanese-like domain-containing protein [Planctomycetota bacterium]
MTQTDPAEIHIDMTMREILEIIPSAQRALFQRYHVGGCSSCGFQSEDSLRKVCRDRNLLDPAEVLDTLKRAHEVDQKMQVQAAEVQGWLDTGEDFSFIDVRPPNEIALASITATEALDFANQERYMALPKDRRFVFVCRDGARSLDVASYFIGHGFTRVSSLRDGLNGWRAEVDASLPNYTLADDELSS